MGARLTLPRRCIKLVGMHAALGSGSLGEVTRTRENQNVRR